MKLLKHIDPNGGDTFGADGVEYESVGRDADGCPIFIVPDHVFDSHINFPHWGASDKELDPAAAEALRLLHEKEANEKIARGESVDPQVEPEPEKKTEKKSRSKSKRAKKG